MAAVPTRSGFEILSGAYADRLATWDTVTRPCRYWPSELLSAFMLQMAATGRCVNESMILGSHDYAIEKLTLAHTLGDDTLQSLATRMFTYFDDDKPCHAVAELVAQSRAH